MLWFLLLMAGVVSLGAAETKPQGETPKPAEGQEDKPPAVQFTIESSLMAREAAKMILSQIKKDVTADGVISGDDPIVVITTPIAGNLAAYRTHMAVIEDFNESGKKILDAVETLQKAFKEEMEKSKKSGSQTIASSTAVTDGIPPTGEETRLAGDLLGIGQAMAALDGIVKSALTIIGYFLPQVEISTQEIRIPDDVIVAGLGLEGETKDRFAYPTIFGTAGTSAFLGKLESLKALIGSEEEAKKVVDDIKAKLAELSKSKKLSDDDLSKKADELSGRIDEWIKLAGDYKKGLFQVNAETKQVALADILQLEAVLGPFNPATTNYLYLKFDLGEGTIRTSTTAFGSSQQSNAGVSISYILNGKDGKILRSNSYYYYYGYIKTGSLAKKVVASDGLSFAGGQGQAPRPKERSRWIR